ncbi:glucose/mannose transport system permease protein [Faunimonas pinastri]|uniref:Glucose/mannose transport system permease protein n=1 Tax=Faunimonas pinastri TaxID=1855383 RepID=A0A1H9DXV5_9HYPH|nr:carbohydrate ABC transporter permease [Faunimonas pinastri]SEQ18301.1 glucose/mannose transport system permease protein [Faunimonas pinastri]
MSASSLPADRDAPIRFAAAVLLSAVFLAPLGMALLTSLKSPAEIVQILSLPHRPDWGNYAVAWNQIGRSFINSIAITLPGALLSVLVGAIGAFPLSQLRGRTGMIIYFFLLTGMLVPYQIVQVPLFDLMRHLGLYNTIPGMWLVHTAYGVPICTFFLRNFFASVPKSIFEAAMLDGCGPAGYFFRILLPASKSGLAALAIIQSRSIWNDLLFAMTLTSTDRARPVTVQLNALTSGLEVQYGPLMASTLISIVPVVVAYLVFQKAFVRGMLGGSSK